MIYSKISEHAKTRMQQRGISAEAIEWLLAYGETIHDHHGAEVCYFTKRSRHNMATDLGQSIMKRYEKFMNSYLVISADGAVITIGHRYQRIVRH